MTSFPDIFRTLVPRVIAAVLLLALGLGVRAQTFIGSYLLKGMPVAASQAPIEEEEEHRHDAKGKASATDRRQRDRVPPPRRNAAYVLLAWVANRGPAITPTRVLPDRESDLRNGFGAPLLC